MSDIINLINEDFCSHLKSMQNREQGAQADYQKFSQKMTEKGYPSEEGYCYKPFFIEYEKLSYIRHATEILTRAITKVINLYYRTENYKKLFSLTPEEQQLVELDFDKEKSIPINRQDAFLGKTYLQYISFEADNLKGFMYADTHGEVFGETKIYDRILGEYSLHRDPIMPHFLRTLLLTSNTLEAGKKGPAIAFIGERAQEKAPELVTIAAWLRSLDYPTSFCEVSELSFDGQKVTDKEGKEIDLLYRLAPTSFWLDNLDKLSPITEALKQQKIKLINPFSSLLFSSNIMFHLLQHPEIIVFFDSEERKIITETIPWTRKVEESQTTDSDGNPIDLLDYLQQHKDHLVLRACSMRENKVITGKETDEENWQRSILGIIENNQSFIAQQMIAPPVESFPRWEPELSFYEKPVRLGFFCHGGLYSGGLMQRQQEEEEIASYASLYCVSENNESDATVELFRSDLGDED